MENRGGAGLGLGGEPDYIGHLAGWGEGTILHVHCACDRGLVRTQNWVPKGEIYCM